MSGLGFVLLVLAALCTRAHAQAAGEPYLEVALLGSATGAAVGTLPPGQRALVESFTATLAISSAGATAYQDGAGGVLFQGGVTQLNVTTQWEDGATNDTRLLAFASESACSEVVAQNTALVYRVSSSDPEVQVDLQAGSQEVASATLDSMASIGDVLCIGIMSQGVGTATSQILAVGDVEVAVPKFPDSFHATIDVNIRSKGYSFTLTESYDHENDAVRSDMYGPDLGDFVVVQDYKDQKIIQILPPSEEHRDGICKETDMSSTDFLTLETGLTVGSPGTQLATTQKFLGFSTDKATPVYIPYLSDSVSPSENAVRGVPVDIWRYTFGKNGSNYQAEFSFAVPQWRTERNWTEARPLRRIHLTGTKEIGLTPESDGPTYVDHTYDYINFQPGIPDWVTFNPCQILPGGENCRCIDFQRSSGSVIAPRGICHAGEPRAGFLLAGILVGAVFFSAIWLLLFWFCAGLTLCNLRRNSTRGTQAAKDMEMPTRSSASASPSGHINPDEVKFDLSGELPNQ